ncbi:type I methionyl aminopeptidase [Pseudonocardia endophytica]|uniref:Methionine aminopeptidase n=1 Tax=Pseudonocardia endophytica TaxID=401976 RepID=A0A4R1HCZ7_PSEEN|nr:type I methionyl aminopeptidase [Pseudonocardia endophytica]TCK19907.1 methionine aminopeptidase type I [Pseudonocardia endophytica]
MIELKTPDEIDAVAAAGQVVGRVLDAVREAAGPGVRPVELDALAADLIADAGARSSFVGYHPSWAPRPFPGPLCVSVNDAVVHGIPTATPLRRGDLLSVDFAVYLDGWCADAAFTVAIGSPSAADATLIDTAWRSLDAGIAQLVPGAKMGDVGHAIASVARPAGYGLMEGFGGHGVGRSMHEDPHVPNEARAGRGLRLQTGMVLALEPMLIAGGGDAYRVDPDGWTLCTADGSRAAHVEHTVAVTADGPRVLTGNGARDRVPA